MYWNGTEINDGTIFNTLFFADGQVLLSCLEDDLQRTVHTLYNTTKPFGMKISKGQVPIRSNIVIDNTVLEQVNTFIYLGCKTLYNEEKGILLK